MNRAVTSCSINNRVSSDHTYAGVWWILLDKSSWIIIPKGTGEIKTVVGKRFWGVESLSMKGNLEFLETEISDIKVMLYQLMISTGS